MLTVLIWPHGLGAQVAVFDKSSHLVGAGGGGPITEGAFQPQVAPGTRRLPPKSSSGPCPDVYIARTDPAGNVEFGTYLGGSRSDQPRAIAVGPDGSVFVAGETDGDFPTTSQAAISQDLNSPDSRKGFVAKISADGKQLSIQPTGRYAFHLRRRLPLTLKAKRT